MNIINFKVAKIAVAIIAVALIIVEKILCKDFQLTIVDLGFFTLVVLTYFIPLEKISRIKTDKFTLDLIEETKKSIEINNSKMDNIEEMILYSLYLNINSSKPIHLYNLVYNKELEYKRSEKLDGDFRDLREIGYIKISTYISDLPKTFILSKYISITPEGKRFVDIFYENRKASGIWK